MGVRAVEDLPDFDGVVGLEADEAGPVGEGRQDLGDVFVDAALIESFKCSKS